MNLKKLAEKSQGTPQPTSIDPDDTDDLEKLKQSVMMDSAIQGSFYFIIGCVWSFMKLKGYEEMDPQEVFRRLKEMKGLTKQELQDSDDPLHEFLLFYYFNDEKRDTEVPKEEQS